VAGSCECGNEPSASIKCGEFLDTLITCYPLKTGAETAELLWRLDYGDQGLIPGNSGYYVNV
jgi:hypothetical protein